MDVLDAIKTRRSIRAYKANPVSRNILGAILDAARYSPSWGNTQCWEMAVATGETLEALKENLVQKAMTGATFAPDIPQPNFSPDEQARIGETLAAMFAAQRIERNDKIKRHEWLLKVLRFFDAPVGIIFSVERSLGRAFCPISAF